MLLIILIAARLLTRDQVRGVYFGYGGYNIQLDAGPEGVHIGFRRTILPWRPPLASSQWHGSVSDWAIVEVRSPGRAAAITTGGSSPVCGWARDGRGLSTTST